MDTEVQAWPCAPAIETALRTRRLAALSGRIAHRLLALSVLLLFCSLVLATGALAQTRLIERYSYDAAGNIIGIDATVVDGPPRVVDIAPDRIFAGTEREFVITGQNLAGASVSTEWPGLGIVSVQAEDERITLTLSAAPGVDPGAATLTIGSSIGSDTVEVLARPALPKLIANPVPVVVRAGGGLERLELSLAEPASGDWLLEIALDDSAIATLATGQIEIVQGQVTIGGGLAVIGESAGSTRLRVRTEGEVLLDTSVISTAAVGLSTGDWEFFSRPLGVRKLRPIQLNDRGPVVGVLGVVRAVELPPSTAPALATSPILGVARSAVLTGVSPGSISRDAGQAELTLSGAGLSGVDHVAVIPDTGLLVSAPVPAADGRSVTVALSIAADAPIGLRRVAVRAGGTTVHAASIEADQFYLAGNLPRIDSVAPILLNPGQTALLTVRGVNFSQTAAVTIDLPDGSPGGVVLDQPLTIGSELIEAMIHVDADAPAGPRRVRVTTAAGATSGEPGPENTLEITRDPLVTIPLFDTRHLTVFKGRPPSPDIAVGPVVARLGVGKGALVADISPGLLETGREMQLAISGYGLGAVSGLTIEPGDGLHIGPLTGDDRSLEVRIDVDPDAARGLRALRVMTPDGPMALARPELGTVRVVSPQPVVEGINPVYVRPGGPTTTVTITGRNFQQAQAVRIFPQTDLQLAAFSVSADGSQITLPVTALASAVTGPRVVQVETPAGATPSEPQVGNQLYIGDPQTRLVTLVTTPLVGVLRDVPVLAPSEQIQVHGTPLGVNRPFVREVTNVLPAYSHRVGLARGPVLFGVAPAIVPRGFAGDLILPGAELGTDLEIAFESGEGIEITGAPVVEFDADGHPSVRVSIAVDTQAPDLANRIIVLDLSDPLTGPVAVPFAAPHAGQLQVAGAEPVIQSISPILTLPDRLLNLQIRGLNLDQATSVRVTPDQGIAVGSGLSIGANGTELTVSLDIGDAAQAGPRLIQVIGPAGASSAVADASNTLTIVEP
ncbi:MAG: IPT/TIG domain-containing protein [Xanthomonadaceae bacterium]|nr:IPT/TIG domain-containing protein [Xanthomonadaceae bacterium]